MFAFSVFLMTCKPPLYLGPEYIKYFSDKTIDVSIIYSAHQLFFLDEMSNLGVMACLTKL